MITALQFIDYYQQAGEIPANVKDEFISILSLLKNRYGKEYKEITASGNIDLINDVICFQQEFFKQLHNKDAYEHLIQTRLSDKYEQDIIFQGINDFCRRELVLDLIEELADELSADRSFSPGYVDKQIDRLIREYDLTKVDLKKLLEAKGISETAHEEQTVREMINQVIMSFQQAIKAVFCVQLRFCSGKDSFPRRIWSSSRHKKYNLDIIQENEAGDEFVFVLYANSPLGSGTLIIKTKEKKLKEFNFTDKKTKSIDFIYKGKIRNKEELYFLIKEK